MTTLTTITVPIPDPDCEGDGFYAGELSEWDEDTDPPLTPDRFATWCKKYAPDPEDDDDE